MDKTFLFISNNRTPQVINVEAPSPVAEAVIIIICYLFGVGYNLIIVITVLYNYQLRTCSFYVLVLQVCGSCLLDCITTESVSFAFLLSGTPWCGFSAAVFHLFLLIHSTNIGLVLLERTLVLKMHMLPVKVALTGVLVSWIFGLVFVSPIFGMFEIHYFPYRYVCSAVKTNLWFSLFSLFGFILVWVLMTVGVIELVCYLKNNLSNKKQLDILSIFPSSSSEILNPFPPLEHCSKNKTTYTLLFLYSILLLPLTISFITNLFLTPMFEPNPWIDPRVRTNKTRSVLTNSLEPLFVYSRYMYNALVPIIVLSSDRDVRFHSRQLFCSKRNVITSFDQSVTSSQNTVQIRTLKPLCSLKAPVLFATSSGIYLRSSQNVQSRLREVINDSNSKVRLIRTFCDLTINSSLEEGSSYSHTQSETEVVGEGRPRVKRCVRFSSQVDAISAPESRLSTWSSNTRTVTTPLYVRGENQQSTDVGQTYTKM